MHGCASARWGHFSFQLFNQILISVHFADLSADRKVVGGNCFASRIWLTHLTTAVISLYRYMILLIHRNQHMWAHIKQIHRQVNSQLHTHTLFTGVLFSRWWEQTESRDWKNENQIRRWSPLDSSNPQPHSYQRCRPAPPTSHIHTRQECADKESRPDSHCACFSFPAVTLTFSSRSRSFLNLPLCFILVHTACPLPHWQ